MKRLLIILFCISSFVAVAQEDTISFEWDEVSWDETINLFYDSGYITAAGGLGNMEPLLFEANIIPYYRIGLSSIDKWAIVLSPQVILRMYNEESYPVRTPSYEPRIVLLHQSSKNKKEYHDWFQYISWYHHSNGQDGYFYTDSTNSKINMQDGSFATNWLEAGVFASRAHSSRQYYAKLSGKYCYLQDTMLNDLYGRWRLNFELKFEWNIAKTLSNLNIHYFDGKESILSNTFKFGLILGDVNHYDVVDWKRGIVDWTISYRPGFLQDVSIFAQYYWGEDYYNIYFNRMLHVFRVGITAQSRFFTRESVLKKP